MGLFQEQDGKFDKKESPFYFKSPHHGEAVLTDILDWHAAVDVDHVLNTFSGFGDGLLKVIRCVTSSPFFSSKMLLLMTH